VCPAAGGGRIPAAALGQQPPLIRLNGFPTVGRCIDLTVLAGIAAVQRSSDVCRDEEIVKDIRSCDTRPQEIGRQWRIILYEPTKPVICCLNAGRRASVRQIRVPRVCACSIDAHAVDDARRSCLRAHLPVLPMRRVSGDAGWRSSVTPYRALISKRRTHASSVIEACAPKLQWRLPPSTRLE